MTILKNVKLAYRLVAGFAGLLLMMIATSGVTVVVARGVTVEAQHARQESAVFAGIARGMKLDAIQIQQWLSDISATRGQDGLADGFDKADEARRSFLKGLAEFREMYRRENDGERLEKLDAIERKLAAYHALGKTMAQAYIDGGPAAGNKHMAAFDKAAEELAGTLDPFVEQQIDELNAAMGSIVASASTLAKATLLAAVLGVVFGALCSWVVTRSITRPMDAAVAAMNDLAEGAGDLTARLDDSGRDEIGQMAAAINRFVGKIEVVVRQVVAAAQHVAAAAQQLSGASEQLSSGASEQASSLEETAASLEQIASTVRQTADNAGQASKLAAGSRDTARKAGQVVHEAVAAMAGINTASKKMADIIVAIDEIAFQTNLLALNAAVEAARAGEQGRGFAVVAAEVRNLAQRSASAAKEIKTLIQDSVGRVGSGSELVHASGQTLEEIVTSVHRVTDIVEAIAAASREQSAGVDQVNTAVAQMDRVVQMNSAQTEELSSTAQSLATHAADLQALVDRFKVSGHAQAARPRDVRLSEGDGSGRSALPRLTAVVGDVGREVAARHRRAEAGRLDAQLPREVTIA
jgi:methyl-accepting chemotaxis protein